MVMLVQSSLWRWHFQRRLFVINYHTEKNHTLFLQGWHSRNVEDLDMEGLNILVIEKGL